MRTIWKYTLEVRDKPHDIDLPLGAEIVHVAAQHGFVTMWVDLDPAQAKETRSFTIHGTGHPVSEYAEYVGTAMIDPFVWHVYEVAI